MARQLVINLPVSDLPRSMEFFKQLGFSFNPQFTDDNAACLVLGEDNFAMLLAEPFFQTFTKKTICDARRSTEVLIAFSCESREEVDQLVAAAVAAGGSIPRAPQDHGFMYAHAFEDLDGHVWEPFHMVPGEG